MAVLRRPLPELLWLLSDLIMELAIKAVATTISAATEASTTRIGRCLVRSAATPIPTAAARAITPMVIVTYAERWPASGGEVPSPPMR